MTLPKRYINQQAKAKRCRRLSAKARHQCQPQHAQRDINALHQGLRDLGLPATLVLGIEGHLKVQKKRSPKANQLDGLP